MTVEGQGDEPTAAALGALEQQAEAEQEAVAVGAAQEQLGALRLQDLMPGTLGATGQVQGRELLGGARPGLMDQVAAALPGLAAALAAGAGAGAAQGLNAVLEVRVEKLCRSVLCVPI